MLGDPGLGVDVQVVDEDPRMGGQAPGRAGVDAAARAIATGHPPHRVEHLAAVPVLAKAHPSGRVVECPDVVQRDVPELEQGPDLTIASTLMVGAAHSFAFVQAVKRFPLLSEPARCTHPSVCMIPVRNSHSSWVASAAFFASSNQ